MTWTDERVAELTRLWSTGLSASEIGKILGVSKNSVVGKAHRMKLESRPSPIKQGSSGQPRRSRAARARRVPLEAPFQSRPTRPSVAPPPGMTQDQRERNATVARGIDSRVLPRRSGVTRTTSCLWPIGDPGDPDFRFCSEPAVPGKSYCAEHCKRAYIVKSRSETEAA